MSLQGVVLVLLAFLIAFVLIAGVWCRNYQLGIPSLKGEDDWFVVKVDPISDDQLQNAPTRNGIPMILHQTFASCNVKRALYASIQHWQRVNTEYMYVYWTDKDSDAFIKEHFDPKVYHAYCTLIPGAAKSDLFRYCVLYRYGGVYANVHLLAFELIAKDLKSITHDGNSFIAVDKQNKYIKRCIDMVVSNVDQQLDLPIPRLTGSVMFETIVNDNKIHCTVNPFCVKSQKASVKYHHSELSKRNLVYQRKVPEDRLIENHNGPIPRNFLQTWSSKYVTHNMYAALASWNYHNPDYGYMYFDDDRCREEVALVSKRALKAYDLLIPGAFKADLWRVCSLYLHGGIYMDADMTCMSELETTMGDMDIVLCIDVSNCTFYNAVMCFKPKMPVLKKMIEYITDNVMARRYDLDHLAVTGPIAITEVMKQVYPELFTKRGRLRAGDYCCKGDNIRVLFRRKTKIKSQNNNVLIHSKYSSYDDERISSGGSDYYYLWTNRLVYHE